jgi:ribosomal RNA assembly protein
MEQSVLIPEERVGVLIGKNGKTKERLEKSTKTKIEIGECVEISGEGLDILKASEIVKAIGRGFSPETAFLLLDDNFVLEIISLEGETKNTIKRLMARVIGRDGSSKKIIEEKTGCQVSVYGKTASVIGPSAKIEKATKAVKQLLLGRSHGFVYGRLKK